MFIVSNLNEAKLLVAASILGLTFSGGLQSSFAEQANNSTLVKDQNTDPRDETSQLDDIVVRGDLSQKNLIATSAIELTKEQISNRVYESPLEIVGLLLRIISTN